MLKGNHFNMLFHTAKSRFFSFTLVSDTLTGMLSDAKKMFSSHDYKKKKFLIINHIFSWHIIFFLAVRKQIVAIKKRKKVFFSLCSENFFMESEIIVSVRVSSYFY